jgi:hypothetical protein
MKSMKYVTVFTCLFALAAVAEPPRKHQIAWKFAAGSETWDADKRDQIKQSMDEATALYNELGEFDKQITVAYSPSTPTADGNYNGNIRFGSQRSKRTALHEIAHTLGVGQHKNWQANIRDKKWTGEHALKQLREFDGPDAVLHADKAHFWPYGLNQERESSPESDRRHVLMVLALRKDMGIENGK